MLQGDGHRNVTYIYIILKAKHRIKKTILIDPKLIETQLQKSTDGSEDSRRTRCRCAGR